MLPALGYHPAQFKALARTISGSTAEAVVMATPCDLRKAIEIIQPVVRARYEFADADESGLGALVDGSLDEYSPDSAAG